MALMAAHHVSTTFKLLKRPSLLRIIIMELVSIDQQLSSIRAEIVSQNKKKMKCMAETVIFVVRRELPFVMEQR